MQMPNTLKSSVSYQLEFQIMLFRVYVQIPLVRGTRVTSLSWKGRDQPVSGGMPGRAARVVAGHSRVPAWLNGSAYPPAPPG